MLAAFPFFPVVPPITDIFKTYLMMVYCYWTFALLFDEKYCYSLLTDEPMLLHTMVVLTSGGTTSMVMLLLLQYDH